MLIVTCLWLEWRRLVVSSRLFNESNMIGKSPVAFSQRYYEKALLSANRFLGLPNPVWSSTVTLMVGLTGWFASGLALGRYVTQYGGWLVGLAVLSWLVLKCLTPRRAYLKRLAREAHQAEVLRVARLYGVDPSSVRSADSEEERQEMENANR